MNIFLKGEKFIYYFAILRAKKLDFFSIFL